MLTEGRPFQTCVNEDFEAVWTDMNTYDIAIRLTDGSRKTMTVRATTANAAERMVKERYPVRYRETASIQIKK